MVSSATGSGTAPRSSTMHDTLNVVKNGEDASGTSVERGGRLVQQSPGVVHLAERQRQDGREVTRAGDARRW